MNYTYYLMHMLLCLSQNMWERLTGMRQEQANAAHRCENLSGSRENLDQSEAPPESAVSTLAEEVQEQLQDAVAEVVIIKTSGSKSDCGICGKLLFFETFKAQIIFNQEFKIFDMKFSLTYCLLLCAWLTCNPKRSQVQILLHLLYIMSGFPRFQE